MQVEIDDDWEPTIEEIKEYADYIGIDVNTEQDMFYLAKEGLKAPLPPNWISIKDDNEDIYYQNVETKETSWDHPCDDLYRQKVIECRQNKNKNKNATDNSNSGKPPVSQAPAVSTTGSSLLDQIKKIQNSQVNASTTSANVGSSVNTSQVAKNDAQQQKAKKDDDDVFANLPTKKSVDDSSIKMTSSLLNEMDPPRKSREGTRAPEPKSRADDGPEVELSQQSEISTVIQTNSNQSTQFQLQNQSQPNQPSVSQPFQQQFDIQQLTEVQKQFQSEIMRLSQEHAAQVRDLTSRQMKEIQEVNMQHIAKVRELNDQNEAELRQIRQNHEKTVTELRRKCDTECDRLRQQLNEQMVSSISLSVPGAAESGAALQNAAAASLVASDALLQKKRELNELKLETEMLEKQIESLQYQRNSLKDDYTSVQQEVQNLQKKLQQEVADKQYLSNEVKTQANTQQQVLNDKFQSPISSEIPLIGTIKQLDCFSTLGTSIIHTILTKQLQQAFLNEKRLISQLQYNLNENRKQIELRIKVLDAKKTSFDAELNLGINLGDKTTKKQLITQRLTIDQESSQLNKLVLEFRESWDWCKQRKQYLNNRLSLIVGSFANSAQILAELESFIEKNQLNEEQLVQKTLDLDASQYLESLYSGVRDRLQNFLKVDEVKRICWEHLAWIVGTEQLDFAKVYKAYGEKMPIMCRAVLKQVAGLDQESTQQSPQPQGALLFAQQNAAWLERLRKGLQ